MPSSRRPARSAAEPATRRANARGYCHRDGTQVYRGGRGHRVADGQERQHALERGGARQDRARVSREREALTACGGQRHSELQLAIAIPKQVAARSVAAKERGNTPGRRSAEGRYLVSGQWRRFARRVLRAGEVQRTKRIFAAAPKTGLDGDGIARLPLARV